jgi:hypothetical protein
MKKSLTLLVLCCFFSVATFASNNNVTLQSNVYTVDDLRPKFRIGFNAPEIDHRQLLLTIDENTCDGFDWGYDAEIFQIFNDDMYWLIDNTKYVIQATNCIEGAKEFAIGIKTTNGGAISIELDQIENPIEGFTLYLKDKELNEIYNLEEGAYQTTLLPGEYHSRYVIVFMNRQINLDESDILGDTTTNGDQLSIGDGSNYIRNTKGDENNTVANNNQLIDDRFVKLSEQLIMYVPNGNNTLTIKNEDKIKINNLTLYNRLGQVTQVWNNVNRLNNDQIYLEINAKKGVYIIQAITEKGNISKRIIL